jgi:hypothetical protein
MKKIIFALILLTGCESTPKNPNAWMEFEQNACLPTAISFREGLRKYNVWSEVVTMSYIDYNRKQKLFGHAIVAYLYPPSKNQLWTYDSKGSYRTRAYITDPVSISQQAMDNRGESVKIIKAQFEK